MAEYRLSPAAELDLEDIAAYTRDQWGTEQASRYIDRLTTAFEELARAPKTAPACDHIRPGYRRRGIERHVIYFRITAYGIAVVRILHDRMDATRHLLSPSPLRPQPEIGERAGRRLRQAPARITGAL